MSSATKPSDESLTLDEWSSEVRSARLSMGCDDDAEALFKDDLAAVLLKYGQPEVTGIPYFATVVFLASALKGFEMAMRMARTDDEETGP